MEENSKNSRTPTTEWERHLELRDKLIKGLELSYQRLVESKKASGGELIVLRDGKVVKIKP